MRLIRRVGFRVRLLAALLCVSIIPAILLGSHANRIYADLLTDELSGLAEETIRHINAELITELRRYELYIDAVSISEEVQRLLSEGRGGIDLRREVERIIMRSHHFRDMVVLDTRGNILYAMGYIMISRDTFGVLLSAVDEASTSDSLYHISTAQGNFLTIGRKIFDFPHGQTHIGYIFTLISDDLLNNLLRNTNSFANSEILFLTADGTVLAGNEAALGARPEDAALHAQLLEAHSAGERSFTYTGDDIPSFAVFSSNEWYNTYLLMTIPLLYISEGAETIGQQLIFLATVTVAVCVMLSMLIYRSVAADWNDMKQQYISDQRRKRDLELESLQYQINPHFLFNTLNTLKWSAVMNDAPPVVSEGITSLSQLLQSVLLSKDEMIPLREELDNLTHYFTIQKIRYADCFEVVLDIDDDVLDNPVPRFILQPLAENSVLHGTEGGVRQIIITIRCRDVLGGVLLEIIDNGNGFDTEALKAKPEDRFSEIGLSNVDERLKLYFGDEHGLEINSILGEGTTCRVFVPNMQKDYEEDGK